MTDLPTLGEDLEPRQTPKAHDAFGAESEGWDRDAEAAPNGPSGRRARTWVAAGVAAVVLGVGGFLAVGALASHTKSVSAASTGGLPGGGGPGGGGGFGFGGPGGGGVFGTIASVNGSSLIVTTPSGSTETVATTAATEVTEAVSGSLSDVAIGDHVVVRGVGTTKAADAITDTGANATTTGLGGGAANGGAPAGGGAPPSGQAGPPGAGGTTVVSGTVAAIGNSGLTVTTAEGTKVAVTSSASTVETNVRTVSLSALTVGAQVQVRGSTSNGTTTATAIEEGASFGPGGPGGPPGPPAAQAAA